MDHGLSLIRSDIGMILTKLTDMGATLTRLAAR
jgi:hypothetical protein